MIKSMTGFGKAGYEYSGKKVNISIKTLNSKQIDLNIKMPVYFYEKEAEIRSVITSQLERGKIELYISCENINTTSEFSLDKDAIKAHYRELVNINDELDLQTKDYMALLMKMPDIFVNNTKNIDEKEWVLLKNTLINALYEVEKFRLDEGYILQNDFIERVSTIEDLLSLIEPYEIKRIENIRDRLSKSLNEMLEASKIDTNRFEQELIYYLEKLDFTEEKVRLKKHLDFFSETLNSDSSEGKKLSFICQEIGREINTIGSKANDADIQHIVVKMKDELEKIKEQLMNIL